MGQDEMERDEMGQDEQIMRDNPADVQNTSADVRDNPADVQNDSVDVRDNPAEGAEYVQLTLDGQEQPFAEISDSEERETDAFPTDEEPAEIPQSDRESAEAVQPDTEPAEAVQLDTEPAEAVQPDAEPADRARERWNASQRRPEHRRRKSHQGIVGFLIGVLCVGLLAVGSRWWEARTNQRQNRDIFSWDFFGSDSQEKSSQTDTEEPQGILIPQLLAETKDITFRVLSEHGEGLNAQQIYRSVNPSVVTVVVELTESTSAIGTGVIFTGDGFFITNYHVVDGGQGCYVLLNDGRRYDALYVAGDEESDLAILKMECEGGMSSAEFGDSDLLVVGDRVYAIGNPLGMEFRGTMTDGIISGTGRDVEVGSRTMSLIQTNAALNTGNSGGPLINEFGQVVGINVVKMSSARFSVEGLGFAIPTAQMERLINDLLLYGKAQPEPILGITVTPISTRIQDGLWGIEVQSVTRGSAADLAGVRKGDYILAADGKDILSSQDLLQVRHRHRIGDEMVLTLWREDYQVEVTLRLTAATPQT